MSKVNHFEELRIWQDARALVSYVYKDFEHLRDFGFRDQIQRAGVSVMNNIAEGFERQSDREFARFLDIAKGSAGEVRSMYYAAEDLKYVTAEAATLRRGLSAQLAKGIKSLKYHLQ